MATASNGGTGRIGSRQISLSVGALALALLGDYAWSARTPAGGAGGVGKTEFLLEMTDYAYSPARMTWRVGDTVTLTIVNKSPAHPGKPHEWMLGRGANTEETVFGPKIEDGFEEPFFEGVEIDVLSGGGLSMLMPGLAKLTGLDPMKLTGGGGMGEMEMGEEHAAGFMPVMKPKGSLTISFKVPDKPGEWTYGCFQQSGQHFLNGMRGVVTVVEG